MKPERWREIETIYYQAQQRNAEERHAFLGEACAGDNDLRRQVEALLEADEAATSFLDKPALTLAAKMIAAEHMPLVGKQFSHYEIIESICAGGMGEVYRARDTKLGRNVALKLLPRSVNRNEERLRRFGREAKAASALNHPNIATIYEIGEANGTHFIAMEYVEGQSLSERINGRPLPITDVIEIAVQIADALVEAHAKGITHRDIKPDNIMTTSRGQVKVLDFGLAKINRSEADIEEAQAGATAPTTQPGVVLGTVPYMSPEQVLGREVDHCSDIFSFGVSVYEMITGRLPFDGATVSETMDRILHAQPEAIARFNYDVPAELERIVRKCLEKGREWRYQSARELLIDLRHLKRDSESSAMQIGSPVSGARKRAQTRPRKHFAAIAIITALTLAIAALIWLITSPFTSRPSPSPALRITPLTTYHGTELFPSFAPDGTKLAFAWDGANQDNFDIYIRSVEHGIPERLTTDPAEDSSPAWSPDGRFIAFLRYLSNGKAGLFLTTPLSRAERQLSEIAAPRRRVGFWGAHLAWSPDSEWIATVDKSSPEAPAALFLISVVTGEKRPIVLQGPSAGDVISPAFSPDGRSLAFVRRFSFYVSEIYVLALTDDLEAQGNPVQLTFFKNQRAGNPVWSQDGREIIFLAGSIWTNHLYRITTSEPGRPQRIESAGQVGELLAISHATQRLAIAQAVNDFNIWHLRLGPDRKNVGASSSLISSTRLEYLPHFSPDGKRIAFISNQSGDPEVWVCDIEGSNPVKLTSFGGPDVGCARWSPDSQRLVFQTLTEGHLDIYLINVRGGPAERLTQEPSDDNLPSWSRDGQWIYFTSTRGGSQQIWKMRTDGSGAVQVTRNGGYAPLESTDGKVVYYVKHAAGGLSVWRVPLHGGEEVEVFTGITDWSNYAPSDNGIYFNPFTESGLGTSLQFFNFADGKIKTVAAISKPVFLGLTIAPDGQSLLYSQMDQEGFDLILLENFL